MTDTRTDAELAAAANAGEAEAMTTLYYRHRGWVLALAHHFCGNHADAEDIMQEVFRYWFGKFPGFELRSTTKTFLYPVVKNKSFDVLRRRRLEFEPQEVLDCVPAPETADEASMRAKFADILAGVPAPDRELLIMRFVDGCSLQEIADALRIPAGTVKSRLHNALKKIRNIFSSR